jgi:hypothetical protein
MYYIEEEVEEAKENPSAVHVLLGVAVLLGVSGLVYAYSQGYFDPADGSAEATKDRALALAKKRLAELGVSQADINLAKTASYRVLAAPETVESEELGAINAKPGDMIFELAITKGKTKHTTFFLVRSDYSTAIVLAD